MGPLNRGARPYAHTRKGWYGRRQRGSCRLIGYQRAAFLFLAFVSNFWFYVCFGLGNSFCGHISFCLFEWQHFELSKHFKLTPFLWNGSKFRLARTIIDAENPNIPTLQLGLTGYKDLLFTNYNYPKNYEPNGLDYDFLSNPLGVASLMITTDKKAIFLKRADWLGENPGMIDVPGGHAEPENLKNDFDDEQKIIKEIFDSQKQEIMEETNTDMSLITSHKMHGLFGLPPSKRPVTYFITYVEKSAKEILTAFNKTDEKYGQTAQEESSYLFEVDLQNLKEFWLKGENMCGNGQFAAGVYLYSVGEISREEFFEVVNRSVAFANKFENK